MKAKFNYSFNMEGWEYALKEHTEVLSMVIELDGNNSKTFAACLVRNAATKNLSALFISVDRLNFIDYSLNPKWILLNDRLPGIKGIILGPSDLGSLEVYYDYHDDGIIPKSMLKQLDTDFGPDTD